MVMLLLLFLLLRMLRLLLRMLRLLLLSMLPSMLMQLLLLLLLLLLLVLLLSVLKLLLMMHVWVLECMHGEAEQLLKPQLGSFRKRPRDAQMRWPDRHISPRGQQTFSAALTFPADSF